MMDRNRRPSVNSVTSLNTVASMPADLQEQVRAFGSLFSRSLLTGDSKVTFDFDLKPILDVAICAVIGDGLAPTTQIHAGNATPRLPFLLYKPRRFGSLDGTSLPHQAWPRLH